MGGIDFVDLANLTYKEHVQNNRVVFQRFKGGTSEWIDNAIHPFATKILAKYEGGKYLVPIYRAKKYKSFRDNYTRRIRKLLEANKVESYITSKTPRYTFINVAKGLQIQKSLRQEIVGHARNDVHSEYEDSYPKKIRDKAHFKVIDAVLNYEVMK